MISDKNRIEIATRMIILTDVLCSVWIRWWNPCLLQQNYPFGMIRYIRYKQENLLPPPFVGGSGCKPTQSCLSDRGSLDSFLSFVHWRASKRALGGSRTVCCLFLNDNSCLKIQKRSPQLYAYFNKPKQNCLVVIIYDLI